MKITDDLIEKLMDHYEMDENAFQIDNQQLMDNQPALVACLSDESMDVLTKDEYDLLWFLATVIYGTFRMQQGTIKEVTVQSLETAEEANWDYWNNSNSSFAQKMELLYDSYDEADLLGFLEDSLDSDEDMEISATGREVMFVTLKSVIDVLVSN